MTITEKTFQEKILAQIAQSLDLPTEKLADSGTTILPNPERQSDAWQPIWHLGKHNFVLCNPHWKATFEAVLSDKAETHILQGTDFPEHESSRMFLYALDDSLFEPFTPDAKYQVRQLNQDDKAAFDTFIAACPSDDSDDADVGLDHLLAFAAFDEDKIIAVASMYELWGMGDIGVLTHPDYRKQGLGKAVVSALSQYQLEQNGELIPLYRHSADNLGSQGVIHGLNYFLFATTDYIKFNQG